MLISRGQRTPPPVFVIPAFDLRPNSSVSRQTSTGKTILYLLRLEMRYDIQQIAGPSPPGARTIFAWVPGRGQAIAPTMDDVATCSEHSRGDGLSSPSSGKCFARRGTGSL